MKFLHTSDWHLGRQFHNVSLLDEQAHVLEQIVNIAQQEQVHAVLIAGDVFDRSVPPATAITLLDNVLHTLCHTLDIPVIIIAGNHDSAERLAFGARHLRHAGLHIIGPLSEKIEPVIVADEDGPVAFYGLPYVEPAQVRALFAEDIHSHDAAVGFMLERFLTHNASCTQRGQSRRCVALSHCFLGGGVASDSERPLCVGGAEQVAPAHFSAFNYAALGHLHAPQYRSAPHIRYSGSILKYSFSEEQHVKSVTLVDLNSQGHAEVQQLPLTPIHNMRSITGYLAELITQAPSDSQREDYLCIRLLDSHALLDVMSQLRAVYPNVLHVERTGLMAATQQLPIAQRLHTNYLQIFSDFYEQVRGQGLSEPQKAHMQSLLTRQQHSEEQD